MFYYENNNGSIVLKSPKISELKKEIKSSNGGSGQIYRGNQLYMFVTKETKSFQGQTYYELVYERTI